MYHCSAGALILTRPGVERVGEEHWNVPAEYTAQGLAKSQLMLGICIAVQQAHGDGLRRQCFGLLSYTPDLIAGETLDSSSVGSDPLGCTNTHFIRQQRRGQSR